jgi:hypothetical protein
VHDLRGIPAAPVAVLARGVDRMAGLPEELGSDGTSFTCVPERGTRVVDSASGAQLPDAEAENANPEVASETEPRSRSRSAS